MRRMRKKRLLCISLMLMLSMLVQLPVGAEGLWGWKDSELLYPVSEKPLQTFNDTENWYSYGNTGIMIPGSMERIYYQGGITVDTNTLAYGVYGRAEDDACFKLSATAPEGTANRQMAVSILYPAYIDYDTKTGSSYIEADRNFLDGMVTVYADLATSDVEGNADPTLIQSGYTFKGFRVTGNLSDTANYYRAPINFTNEGKMQYLEYNGINTERDVLPEKWYSVAMQFYGNTHKYDGFLEGEKIVEYTIMEKAPFTSISDISIGHTIPDGKTSTLYIDNIAIYFNEPFSNERYAALKDAAAISFMRDMAGENTSIDEIRKDVTLPTEGAMGSTITWESSNTDVVATDGTVTQDTYENKEVTLTATIKNGDKEEKREFKLTVISGLGANGEDVYDDMQNLTFETIRGFNGNAGAIVSDLVLPEYGEKGSRITWTSSEPDVISTSGKVKRYADKNKRVTLTATLTRDAYEGEEPYTDTVEFNLNVIGDMVFESYMVDAETALAEPLEKNEGLTYSSDAQRKNYGARGLSHGEGGATDAYAVYDAMGGSNIEIHQTGWASYNSTRNHTISIAGEDGNFSNFTDFVVERVANIIKPGEAANGGWWHRVYTGTKPLPAGTRYIRINIGTSNNKGGALLSEVHIGGYGNGFGNDVCFADIAGENTSMNAITGNLDLASLWGVSWQSSDNSIINAATGEVTRGASDSTVTLTATIDTPDLSCVKVFTLKVLAAE